VFEGSEKEKCFQSDHQSEGLISPAEATVSIVIPCLNEEGTLADVVGAARAALERYGFAGQVIVVNNGSVDRSRNIASELAVELRDVPERGYGRAIIAGVQAAQGKYVIIVDADDTYCLDEIDRVMAPLQKSFDLVIGTRLKGRIERGAMPVLHRYIGTPLLTFLINILFGTKISDCNGGMRGFTKETFDRLKLRSDGMEFASEMIIKAALLKLRITEVPITLRPDRRLQPPHLRTWTDGWRHLRLIVSHWAARLF
jgi:glycosyltransferase involved in cell wall biosynthesis